MGVMAIDLLNSDMFKSQGDVGKNFPSHYSSLKKKKKSVQKVLMMKFTQKYSRDTKQEE